MKLSNIIHSSDFNGIPLPSSFSLHGELLQRLHERLRNMVERHRQVLAFALVIQFPCACGAGMDNKLFSRFLADFIRHLNPCDPSYVWCREETPSSPGRFHYHLVLLLDGSRTQNPWGHLDCARHYWSRTLGLIDVSGLVHLCEPESPLSFNHSGFKLVRSSPAFQPTFEETFKYLSYIAKTESKRPVAGTRAFGCSELERQMG